MSYCRDDKTARISNALRKVFVTSSDKPRTATTGERSTFLRDRWPNSSAVDLGESAGCSRDGHIRSWRASA